MVVVLIVACLLSVSRFDIAKLQRKSPSFQTFFGKTQEGLVTMRVMADKAGKTPGFLSDPRALHGQFVVSKRCVRISPSKRCVRISPSKRCVRISLSKRCVRISPPLEGRGRGGVFDPKVGYLSQRLFLCFSNMTFSALWV